MAAKVSGPKFGEHARRVMEGLFERAFKRAPFHFLCTMLRIEPASEEEWDPLAESHGSLQQYATQIQTKPGAAGMVRHEDRRLALLIYCHLTEIAVIYQVLANALRGAKGYPYLVDPFADLVKAEVRPEFRRPPTPAQRIDRLEHLEARPAALVPLIESFFEPDLRDAFYRSEYVLTRDTLRYRTLAGPIREMAWGDAEDLVRRVTSFYNAFFSEYYAWMQRLGKIPTEMKIEGVGAVQILMSADDSLCGIQWIRPDGMPCSFLRLNGAVSCNGIAFSPRGELVLRR